MDAKKFLDEARRMCKAQEGCGKCLMTYGENICFFGFDKLPGDWTVEEIDGITSIVEQWSAEHPRKTRLQDFLEKYPDAPLGDTGFPIVRPELLGYCQETDCLACRYTETTSGWCWEQEAREDETD